MIKTIKMAKVLFKPTLKRKWQPLLSFFLLFIIPQLSVKANDTSPINSMATVSSIVQDSKGFIWLAGQRGLTRFDGNQTINFSSSNTTWPLPVNWLHDVAVDEKHLLLATETDGLWRFNPETGKANKILTNIKRNSYYNVAKFQDSYYINAPNKLYRYQINTKKTTLIEDNISIRKIVHNKQHLYLSSKSGFFQLEGDQLRQLLTEPILASTSISSGVIAVTKSNIYYFDHLGNKKTITSSQNISAITKEFGSDNFFAFNSQGTISKFAGKTLKELSHKFSDIPPIRARSLLHDNSGVLWLVSTQGIQRLTENSIKNIPIVFDININANTLGLVNDDIVMGTYGAGLQNFTASVFNNKVNANFSKQGLRITNILTIDDTLYIATFDGLWSLGKEDDQAKRIDFPDNNKLILTLEYEKGRVYIGSNYNGLYTYDIAQNKIISNITPEHGLSNLEIIDILPLSYNQKWLATRKAIDILNNQNKIIKNIPLPNSGKVISLLKVDNKIFATTTRDGIYAFNLQGEILAKFGQGVRYSRMFKINNEVWVAGRPGLYRFNPTNYQLSMIENTEQYSFAGSFTLKNNIVYASHYSGVLTLDLSNTIPFNPCVYISKTTVSGHSYLLNKSIEIENGNDVITLDLASLDYRPGMEKKYRYKINNSAWNQINSNQLTLTGLASGNYHIEIMATNSLGQWSNYKAFTEINVAFPWYWAPQVRFLYALLLLGFLSFAAWLLYLRSQSISRIYNILQSDINDFDKTNQQIKRNLTAAVDFLQDGNKEKTNALLEQCVTELSTQQKTKEPSALKGNTLSVALPFLAEYLQSKYQVKVNYQIDIQDDELDYQLQADLYRVIFEALIYAILKGGGRNFKVILQTFKNKIWLNISDDQKSFIHFNSKVSFDISMYYIRQIATKHNGSINTFNEHGNGSQLVLSLPNKPVN